MLGAMARLAIDLLGAPSIRVVDAAQNITLPGRALALLTYLAVNADAPVSRDSAAFALWPDDTEEQARATLRRMLYLMQRAFPEEKNPWFRTDRRTVQWNRDAPAAVDVIRYADLADAGRFEEAAALYRGDLASGLEDEWIVGARERMRDRHLELLDRLVALHRERGNLARAIEFAQAALRCDPWRETVVRDLVTLRAQSGDRAGAMRELKTFTESLEREMGMKPMPETLNALHDLPEEREKPKSNLPAPITSFVGRKQEIHEICDLMGQHRLLTLTGPGGVGKTRLAIACAEELQEEYADGVRIVDLTLAANETALLRNVAHALDLQDVDRADLTQLLAQTLQSRQLLLLLDNCERTVDECSALALTLLAACPRLSILATSRETLGVAGGAAYDVLPLANEEAVELLCERVRAVHPAMRIDAGARDTIAAICRRLDGIPLAIELAASRARTFTPQQILDRLDDRFALLAGSKLSAVPHHQTLRGAIDWSYDLLEEDEARFLSALCVFRGTFDLNGARSVCLPDEGETAAADLLEALVEKSFVQAAPGANERRFKLLETIREYVRAKLVAAGRFEETRRRHLRYYTSLAEGLEGALTGGGQESAMAALVREDENLRAALERSADDTEGQELQLRLVGALAWYYWFRGYLQEGYARSSAVLSFAAFSGTRAYARALATQALCARELGDARGCLRAAEAALAIYGRSETGRDAVIPQLHAAAAELFNGDVDGACKRVARAMETAAAGNDAWLQAYAFAVDGLCKALGGDVQLSLERFQRAVDLLTGVGERFQRAFWLLNLAVQQFAIAPEEGAQTFLTCCREGLDQNSERIAAGCLEGFAWCLCARGEAALAAQLLAASEVLRERRAQALLPQWRATHDRVTESLKDTLGPREFESARRAGLQWPAETATEEICARAIAAMEAQPAAATA